MTLDGVGVVGVGVEEGADGGGAGADLVEGAELLVLAFGGVVMVAQGEEADDGRGAEEGAAGDEGGEAEGETAADGDGGAPWGRGVMLPGGCGPGSGVQILPRFAGWCGLKYLTPPAGSFARGGR